MKRSRGRKALKGTTPARGILWAVPSQRCRGSRPLLLLRGERKHAPCTTSEGSIPACIRKPALPALQPTESLWQDPYIVKLYGITVPPSCLVPFSCSLSPPLSHTLTPAHRGAPPPRNACPGRSRRCGRCPGFGPGCSRRGTGMGLPQHPAQFPPPRLPARLTLMLGLLAPPPPPRRISSEWLFLG